MARGDVIVGPRITSARCARRLSGRQVALAAGIAPSSLARIEADEVSPTVRSLSAIARALDVDLIALFQDAPRRDHDHERGA